jgi:hypothetical protein
MKYTRKQNTPTGSVSINKLEPLTTITEDTAILVYNPKEGTRLITIEDLIALLDIRYAKNQNYDANALVNAVDKIFNSNSSYDPNYVNINKQYIDDKIGSIASEHNEELIGIIDELFNPKK